MSYQSKLDNVDNAVIYNRYASDPDAINRECNVHNLRIALITSRLMSKALSDQLDIDEAMVHAGRKRLLEFNNECRYVTSAIEDRIDELFKVQQKNLQAELNHMLPKKRLRPAEDLSEEELEALLAAKRRKTTTAVRDTTSASSSTSRLTVNTAPVSDTTDPPAPSTSPVDEGTTESMDVTLPEDDVNDVTTRFNSLAGPTDRRTGFDFINRKP